MARVLFLILLCTLVVPRAAWSAHAAGHDELSSVNVVHTHHGDHIHEHKVAGVGMSDPLFASEELGECSFSETSVTLDAFAYSSETQWTDPRSAGSLAEKDDVRRYLCLARIERALGSDDGGLALRMIEAIARSEGEDASATVQARLWLVLETAEFMIERGNRTAAERLLNRNRASLTDVGSVRRADLLEMMIGELPDPGPDGLAAMADWLIVQQSDNDENGAVQHETLLLGWRFVGLGYLGQASEPKELSPEHRKAAQSAFEQIVHIADPAALHDRRFVADAHRELAAIALSEGRVDAAKIAEAAWHKLAFVGHGEFPTPLGKLDGGLSYLSAQIKLENGGSLKETFASESVADQSITETLYADRALEFQGLQRDDYASVLNLYRDVYEARGTPDAIARPSVPEFPQLPVMAFDLAQRMASDGADDSVSFANALRRAYDDETRASLIERARLNAESTSLIAQYAMLGADADPSIAGEILARLQSNHERIEREAKKFGDADELRRDYSIHPWYLGMRQWMDPEQAEAFLLIVPAHRDIHVFAIGYEHPEFAWHRIKGGVAIIDPLVARLRCQVDPTGCPIEAAASLAEVPASPLELAQQRGYDRNAAYQLYDLLIRPVEAALSPGSDIFTVASGSMASLPLSALVTEPPPPDYDWADYSAMRDASWLGDRYAFTSTPSLASFRPQRMKRINNVSEDMLFAIANPAFDGVLQPGETRSADFFVPTREGILADLAAIRSLAPLPGTKAEYERIIETLAPIRQVSLLGPMANEGRLRRSSELEKARIVLIATHGLLPGQNRGELGEPALVLTPPGFASRADDGLLTASEVRSLDLVAEWVILSACNTAAGSSGGESLSQLASAFLRAGALQVLASHWPVLDEITPFLTSETLLAAKEQPLIGPGRALRQAMHNVRTGTLRNGGVLEGWKESWAHPIAWAPFVVISNGDEAIINDRFEIDPEY